jgi:hypothetical protein
MKFDDRYPWVLEAWEAFEMTLLTRGKSNLISRVGNHVRIRESQKVSRKKGFDRVGMIGEEILISSKLSEVEKKEILYFLLLSEAEDLDRNSQ